MKKRVGQCSGEDNFRELFEVIMAGKCRTCFHPDRELIDAAILGKASYRTVADRFELSETALKRHAANHIPDFLAKSRDAEEVLQADRLLAEEQEDRELVRERFKKLSATEPKGSDKGFWLQCRREVKGSTELLLRATGAWRERLGLDVSGGLTATVEQKEADSIRFIEERHPELRDELLTYLKELRAQERAS